MADIDLTVLECAEELGTALALEKLGRRTAEKQLALALARIAELEQGAETKPEEETRQT